MISSLWAASWRCSRSSRFSSRASISSWTRAAAVMKPTDKPFWQAASPSPRAMCVFPVPLLPTAITLSRRARYSQRASSSTKCLVERRDRREVETVQALHRREPCLLNAALDHPPFPVDQFEFGQAQQVTRMVDTLGAHCWASLSYSRKNVGSLSALR